MLTFLHIYRELCGNIQELPEPLAKRLVQRAHRSILDGRNWSFLVDEGTYFTPGVITAGTMSVTQNSNVITPNATALAALNGLTNPLITRRQIRFGSTGSPLYNIHSYNGATLGLDRPYLEATNSTQTYQVYRCYYTSPLVTSFDSNDTATTDETTDFAELIAVWDTVNGFPLRPIMQGQLLSRTDPLRGAVQQPFRIYAYRTNQSTFAMTYEWWPHPTSELTYKSLFKRKGTLIGTSLTNPDSPDEFNDDATLQPPLSDDLLIQRSMMEAVKWAKINVTKRVSMSAWDNVLRDYRNDFKAEFQRVSLRDQELSSLHEFSIDWSGIGFGVMDSNYMQSHLGGDVWNLLG